MKFLIIFCSAKGPGSAIGNLYYFSWLSFLCTVMLVASCYADLTGGTPASNSNNDEDKDDNGDIQVEQLPADQEQF